jgi:hypothetical protein
MTDPRITHARQLLADFAAAVDDETTPYEPHIWAARLGVAVEELLVVVETGR